MNCAGRQMNLQALLSTSSKLVKMVSLWSVMNICKHNKNEEHIYIDSYAKIESYIVSKLRNELKALKERVRK